MAAVFLSSTCPDCHVCRPDDELELLHGLAVGDSSSSYGHGVPLSSMSGEAKYR